MNACELLNQNVIFLVVFFSVALMLAFQPFLCRALVFNSISFLIFFNNNGFHQQDQIKIIKFNKPKNSWPRLFGY